MPFRRNQRRIGDLDREDAERIVRANERVMRMSLRRGGRSHHVYRASRRGCPECGGRITARGQGDANRATYWCASCQR